MRLLIVAATSAELDPFQDKVGWKDFVQSHQMNNHDLDILISGVGMVATAFSLGKQLNSKQYDLIINVGLAGSFDRSISLGEVVEVQVDQFSELGAEDGESFLDLQQIGLQETNQSPFKEGKLFGDPIENNLGLKKVEGITVNTVHGNEASIEELKSRLNPDVESMEGAACFYACNLMQVKCIQIRSISNYVEKRNRAAWQIKPALNNLAEKMVSLINELP